MDTRQDCFRSGRLRLGILDASSVPMSVRLAPRIEALGYDRYWISEHHGEGAISNPTLLVPVIASMTERIRVGTAAVLLRYQSAVAVAENFRMLARLYPGRIDLALGRSSAKAPFDGALLDGRPATYAAGDHAAKVLEVQRLLRSRRPEGHPFADVPIDPRLTAEGTPSLWVASSSRDGAELAASIGACYTYSDHFNWRFGRDAVRRYANAFGRSHELASPKWNVCIAGFCAGSDGEAREIAAAQFAQMPPERRAFVGTAALWRDALEELTETYETDEIIVRTLTGRYDTDRQLDSFARIMEIAESIRVPRMAPSEQHPMRRLSASVAPIS